jgi:2-methylcitrate dehydratase PrpD
MTLARELVRLIRTKTITGKDREIAALFVLDTLACALGAREAEPARMIGAVAPPASGDIARRAFHLGGLAHILEMDDLHRGSVTHPGCVVIPAAWALAEARDAGGHDFLDAVIAGYEACCRIGMSVGREHYRIWHNTSTCGPFGSAMAAAELLRLSEDAAVWALGNAGTQSCGLWQFLESGAMSKHLHTARAAESGLLAALLAAEGFSGAPDILEGPKGFYAGLCPDPAPEAVTADPDNPRLQYQLGRVLDLREPRQTFRFIGVERPPIPSLLRRFSAPVRLKLDLALDFLVAECGIAFECLSLPSRHRRAIGIGRRLDAGERISRQRLAMQRLLALQCNVA